MNVRERAIIAGKLLYRSIHIAVDYDDSITIEIYDTDYGKGANGDMVAIESGNSVIKVTDEDYRRLISNILFAIWSGVFGDLEDDSRLDITFDKYRRKWISNIR